MPAALHPLHPLGGPAIASAVQVGGRSQTDHRDGHWLLTIEEGQSH